MMFRIACFVSVLFIPIWMWAARDNLLTADSNSQEVQNARADADNLSRMQSVSMIRRFAREGYLVAVPSSTRFYYLHAIPSGYRYCRPWTKLFLERISRRYYDRFQKRLRITSLIRTVGMQEVLARRNGNAADAYGASRSSHLTGATVDISKKSMPQEGIRWMRSVLYDLKKQDYMYAIEEFEQPTFHVMVYRKYLDHADSTDSAKLNPPVLLSVQEN